MVGAVMALSHLFRSAAKRQCEHLMSQTDSKDWDVVLEEGANGRNSVLARRGGIPWPVGKQHPCPPRPPDLPRPRLLRAHPDICPNPPPHPPKFFLSPPFP